MLWKHKKKYYTARHAELVSASMCDTKHHPLCHAELVSASAFSSKKICLLILISLIFFFSCSTKDDFNYDQIINPDFSESAQIIEEYLTKQKFQGSILVSKDKEILFAKGYGVCDKKDAESPEIQINTTFEIGSISKQMTAAAIMQLEQKKKLSVQDKISKYFPDFQYGDQITIDMLLNMHSGLTDCLNATYEFFPTKIADQIERATVNNEPIEDKIILKYLNDAPLFIEPGSSYFYCNTNYYLLADIVEQVSGLPFKQYMQENIFTPCKMTNTNMEFQQTQTKGYDWKNRYYSIPDTFSKGYGDINSTVIDLYKWTECFVNGKVVRKKTFKKMIDTESYGYGVNVQNGEIFHGGATDVFNSFIAFYPEEKITIIVLINQPQNEKYAATIARSVHKTVFEKEEE